MNRRSAIAAALVLAFVMETPVTARAQEIPAPVEAPPIMLTRVVPVVPLIAPIGARPDLAAPPALSHLTLFAPTPEQIRLSHGAKVAIIVSAIVVGSLIVLGLVVFSTRPGRL